MRIAIGIPCFDGVSGYILEEYMRFAYYLGRRCPEHEFFLAIREKMEQFRARNSIVENALQSGCDAILMLDDDMVIDTDNDPGWREADGELVVTPVDRYAMIKRLIEHDKPIVGPLYFQRGGYCRPVVMREAPDGGYYFLRDDELTGGLQEVAVQGGGCMLVKREVFDFIDPPWFAPEFKHGTDIQICEKARQAGFSVWCDTGIELGHLHTRRDIVTRESRARFFADMVGQEGLSRQWTQGAAINLYMGDVQEYLGVDRGTLQAMAERSLEEVHVISEFSDVRDYYRTRGPEILARNACFHAVPSVVSEMDAIVRSVRIQDAYGLDFGCGSAPVGFELLKQGHRLDFVDIEGAPSYEFIKWRVRKHDLVTRTGWGKAGPYDYVLMLDVIEHLPNWQEELEDIVGRLKSKGALITNFFHTHDHDNAEHVMMDHDAVKRWLTENNVFPVNDMYWIKDLME